MKALVRKHIVDLLPILSEFKFDKDDTIIYNYMSLKSVTYFTFTSSERRVFAIANTVQASSSIKTGIIRGAD